MNCRRWVRPAGKIVIFAALAVAVLVPGRSGLALADDVTSTPPSTATATATLVPTATPTVAPTPTVVPTKTPTATPRPRPAPTREVKTRRVRHHTGSSQHHRRRQTTPTAQATTTPTPTPVPEKHHRARHHHHAKRKPTATPTPTATRVPALSLSTDDSVRPVTCNRGPAGPASAPFLSPPYHGWTSIVSYVDHDSPNYVQDGTIITASGLEAAPDGTHQRTDFPAYWNAGIRQYVYYDGHNGYDYDVWYQPLYAAAAGRVIFARFEYPDAPAHGYGKMVMIQHRGGYVTLYGHLSKFLVHKGEKVRAGEEIGISGNTGHSTGPHLHFTVFHNCTPTDPYGWTGPGPDPLSSYEGELSEWLWKQAPLVVNPLPHWPGLSALPAAPSERLVLLRLPPTSGGTDLFLANLRAEADTAAKALRASGATVHEDLLRGLLEVDGAVDPAQIYQTSGVVSISSPDIVEGAKSDVLAALAHAALVKPQHPLVLNRAHHWTGYFVRWQGRTLLVGRGSKGARVNLRLSSGRGGSWHRIAADPHTGAYAVDLGPMTSKQYLHLRQSLQQHPRQRDRSVQPSSHSHAPARAVPSPGSGPGYLWLALPVLIFFGAVGATVLRRRLAPAVSGGDGGRDQVE